MIKVLIAAAEAEPFASAGGLGDVIGSLPKALLKAAGKDAEIRVVIPLYRQIRESWAELMHEEWCGIVPLVWRKQKTRFFSIRRGGIQFYFVDQAYYFDRSDGIYGYPDDGERYAFFCMSIFRLMTQLSFIPDILHCHDWHTALAAVYLRTLFSSESRFSRIRSLYTIHNIAYQGCFDFSMLQDVFGLHENCAALLDDGGKINLTKAAIVCADYVSTVSPRYARELQKEPFACGLSHLIRQYAGKMCGILNGIDKNVFDPEKDSALAKNYSAKSAENKVENKRALRNSLQLPQSENVPLLFLVSRLTWQKGIGLFLQSVSQLLREQSVQIVVLGTGDAQLEDALRELAERYPMQVRVILRFDRQLAAMLYAAGDIFLMPSETEPCGLAQMIACRYGAIPVVHETGGLADSVKPFAEKNGVLTGNGFLFAQYDVSGMEAAVKRAIAFWQDPLRRLQGIRQVMQTDFSWNISAVQYLALYRMIRYG